MNASPFLPLVLKIGKASIPVRDLVDASHAYQNARDESGEGASTFPHGQLMKGARLIAEVSYNGKVWAPEDAGKNWKPGALPLLEAQ